MVIKAHRLTGPSWLMSLDSGEAGGCGVLGGGAE
jgi:hypothetical protein